MHFIDLYTFDENETTALDTYDRIIECYESLFAELSLDTVKGQYFCCYVMILLFCLFSVTADLKLFVEILILLQVFFYVLHVCKTNMWYNVYSFMCRGVLFVSFIALKPLHFLLSTKGFIFSLFPGHNIRPLSWQELVFLHQLLCACRSALYMGLTLVSGRHILLSCWTMAGTADSNAVTCYWSCLYLHGNTPDTKIICDGNFLLALLWSVACKIDDQSTKISRCDVK